jgi:hypothetical protein
MAILTAMSRTQGYKWIIGVHQASSSRRA